MKVFATITLVLSAIGSLLGFAEMVTGNSGEALQGTLLLGGGFTGILLSCLVIAVVDIRTCLIEAKNPLPIGIEN